MVGTNNDFHTCFIQCNFDHTAKTKYTNITIDLLKGVSLYLPNSRWMKIASCGHLCYIENLGKCCQCEDKSRGVCQMCTQRKKYQYIPEMLRYIRSHT